MRARSAAWFLHLLIAVPTPAQAPAEAAEAAAPEPVPAGAPPAMASIERDGLRTHATHLASDDLGGRFTGSDGQVEAAHYIAGHFEELGLLPLGDGRGKKASYFQKYPLERTYLDPKLTSLTIGAVEHAGGFAVVPHKKGGKVVVKGRFLFCGDGSPDEMPKGGLRKYIPVIVLDERTEGPRQGMGSRRALLRAFSILRELKRRGAGVGLFCLVSESGSLADQMNYGALLPGKPLLRYGNAPSRAFQEQDLPAVFVGGSLAANLLAQMGVDPMQPAEDRPEAVVEGRVALGVRTDKKFRALNVVAYLEGSHAKLSKEAVVFSAHMDHMGTRLDGDVFNGADDNASGTAGLLEVAQAFAAGEAPARSVIFLAVSGEELGLWGSAYYAANPTWRLQQIVANVNIDMIGRATELSGAQAISVTPSFRHPEYSTLVRDASGLATRLGLELSIGDTYYQRSDHYNFAIKGVPVVFFCDGDHADYHRVTDHAELLDYGKMERVARLAFWTGWEAAQAAARPGRLGSQQTW